MERDNTGISSPAISKRDRFLPLLFLIALSIGCSSEQTGPAEIPVTELSEYETIVSVEDAILAAPKVLKYDDNTSHFFTYDAGNNQVFELTLEGTVDNIYGRAGRGPGEFQVVNNIFLTDNRLYAADKWQYLIHFYDLNGEYISSIDFGAIAGSRNIPSAPFSRTTVAAQNIDNQPFITSNGNLLISTVQTGKEVNSVYELRKPDGEILAHIGELPESSALTLDMENYRQAIEDQRVPDFYKPLAFPVADKANPSEFFLVYSALGNIEKYNADGNKLWESKVPDTPEMKSFTKRFFEISERFSGNERIAFSKYLGGTTDRKGNLFLAMGKSWTEEQNFIWVHQFGSEGTLEHRYKIISEQIGLSKIFDVDTRARRFFIVTKEGEIRAYPF